MALRTAAFVSAVASGKIVADGIGRVPIYIQYAHCPHSRTRKVLALSMSIIPQSSRPHRAALMARLRRAFLGIVLATLGASAGLFVPSRLQVPDFSRVLLLVRHNPAPAPLRQCAAGTKVSSGSKFLRLFVRDASAASKEQQQYLHEHGTHECDSGGSFRRNVGGSASPPQGVAMNKRSRDAELSFPIPLSGKQQLIVLWRLFLSMVSGAAIGWERRTARATAGVRTLTLVSLGSAIFTLTTMMTPSGDAARTAAQVSAGVGFIGAGCIRSGGDQAYKVKRGLTTAASIWLAAAVGVAQAFGLWKLGLLGAFLTIATLRLGAVTLVLDEKGKGPNERLPLWTPIRLKPRKVQNIPGSSDPDQQLSDTEDKDISNAFD
ncbi:Protein SrpB [Porphyridium purpureum]|uniref:Protein SrpB n=1 Tax=Porphyridium purpureum TaxID=35688 RepID=A0A5J4YVB7_PORPP|nr:Protein SrpB [Porphyridium purpureum]|eukprot:POR1074..scf209_3